MRKDFGSKPWFYPMPVLVIGTYGGLCSSAGRTASAETETG